MANNRDTEKEAMRKRIVVAGVLSALVTVGCAGRTPDPVETVQLQDDALSCTDIQQEITANQAQMRQLDEEDTAKVVQNIIAGAGGVLFFPVWAFMDFQNAPGIETDALQQRNAYLATVYAERCEE